MIKKQLKANQFRVVLKYEGDTYGDHTKIEDTPEFILEAYDISVAGIIHSIAHLRGCFNKEGRITNEAKYLSVCRKVKDVIANPPILVEKEKYENPKTN